jgi:sulfur carrier protein ThiS adenylyltransferase
MSNRYSRQEAAVNQNLLNDIPITIVGLGAIGRELALKLAQMGAGKLSLVDFDTVEEPNICTQGYTESDVGKPKVEVSAEACININKDINIELFPRRFSAGMKVNKITFCCVDSMEARKLIWDTVKENTDLFIDTRMSTEVLRVLVANNDDTKAYYETTLFSDEQAYQEGCTTKATCYCASIAAGVAASNLAKWSRAQEDLIEKDFTYNILAAEVMVA